MQSTYSTVAITLTIPVWTHFPLFVKLTHGTAFGSNLCRFIGPLL